MNRPVQVHLSMHKQTKAKSKTNPSNHFYSCSTDRSRQTILLTLRSRKTKYVAQSGFTQIITGIRDAQKLTDPENQYRYLNSKIRCRETIIEADPDPH
jgi:hypothetical protein